MTQTPLAQTPLTAAAAWQALSAHAESLSATTIRDLFDAAGDHDRAAEFSAQGAGWLLDMSKQRVTAETLDLLVALAEERDVAGRREAMFTGMHLNNTEDRAVLHTALRLPPGAELTVDGQDVAADVHEVLVAMGEFAEQVRGGTWLGFTGQPIRNVVNIGIGGSDLGPVMAYLALRSFATRDLVMRFVSNVDGTDFVENTHDLDPAETLFLVASKTFTTQETMTNARTARDWLVAGLGGDSAAVARHFVAISTNAEKVAEFGIDTSNMFGFWDWVGGRYSMSSAIGLSTMLAVGPDQFSQMLAGLHAMDTHFRHAPARENLPLLHGLLCVWNRNFLGSADYVVLPYDQYLVRFPAYLQQMIMESNGKRVTSAGAPVDYDTSASFWGEPGTNGQHSFYQMLHQGTTTVPADFLFFTRPANDVGTHHDLLVANCLAQSGVMAFGRTADEVAADGTPAELVEHKVMPGNRPNNMLVASELTPFALGALVSLYEHSTFVQGAIWDINSYDQWGVQLGKVVADSIAPMLTGQAEPALDASTNALVRRYLADRGR
ncbi:MAG: glucose-6-phosphate isomerase [Candidatus Nanopelagicales bacterium]